MAKDRDRRYQTPEQLVRDLLTVAGALGLRSVSPEGLVWIDAAPPPAWERHLVWGVPALAFAAIAAFLAWGGSGPEPSPRRRFPPEAAPAPPRVAKSATAADARRGPLGRGRAGQGRAARPRRAAGRHRPLDRRPGPACWPRRPPARPCSWPTTARTTSARARPRSRPAT